MAVHREQNRYPPFLRASNRGTEEKAGWEGEVERREGVREVNHATRGGGRLAIVYMYT